MKLCDGMMDSKAPSPFPSVLAKRRDARKEVVAILHLVSCQVLQSHLVTRTQPQDREAMSMAPDLENIFWKDSREGHRDGNGTASFEGRGRSRLGANAICFSRRPQKHDIQHVL